jgi:hypothetical protein
MLNPRESSLKAIPLIQTPDTGLNLRRLSESGQESVRCHLLKPRAIHTAYRPQYPASRVQRKHRIAHPRFFQDLLSPLRFLHGFMMP